MFEELKTLHDKIESTLYYFGKLDKTQILKIASAPLSPGLHKDHEFIQDQIEMIRKKTKGTIITKARIALIVAISRRMTLITELNKLVDSIIFQADKFKPLQVTLENNLNINGYNGEIVVEKRTITPEEAGVFIGSIDALIDLLYKYNWIKSLNYNSIIETTSKKPTKRYSTANAIALYIIYAQAKEDMDGWAEGDAKEGVLKFCKNNEKKLRIKNPERVYIQYSTIGKKKERRFDRQYRNGFIDAIELLREQKLTKAADQAQEDLIKMQNRKP